MINIANKSSLCIKCKERRASFNIEGERPKYCAKCKTSDMINVVSRKCQCSKGYPTKYCCCCLFVAVIHRIFKKQIFF